MKSLVKILKGALVGIGSIVPGISGSMIATILKIYEQLVTALNRFLKEPIKAIVAVWEYILGVIIGLFIGFYVITYFFQISPLVITFLFVGFILGSIPSLYKEFKGTETNYKHILTFIVTVVIMLLLLLIQEKESVQTSYFYIIIIGLITSAALIIPGVSGATILLALGFYQTLLHIVNELIKAVVTLNIDILIKELPAFLLLVLGIILGLIIMGKIMFYLLNNKRKYFTSAVLAIVIVSPINIFFALNNEYSFNVEWYFILLGIIVLTIGFIISKNMLNQKGEEND